jgi:DNA-binding CsgD family transcriptional regulator
MGELHEAGTRLGEELRASTHRGERNELPFVLYHLSELEAWHGRLDVAERLAEQSDRIAADNRQWADRAAALYVRAFVAALRGDEAETVALTSEGMELASSVGSTVRAAQCRAVRGFLRLSQDALEQAAEWFESIRPVVAPIPIALPFLSDDIEVLTRLGDLDAARRLLEPLSDVGQRLRHPWALAVAARCRGLIQVSNGDTDGALAALRTAVPLASMLERPLEQGRTSLALGTVLHRARKRGVARQPLESAVDSFSRAGARLWKGRAEHTLANLGTGASARGALTPMERRVVVRVATGATNREVAGALFLSRKTVEAHLASVYRKLHIHTRGELIRWYAARDGAVRSEELADQSPGIR